MIIPTTSRLLHATDYYAAMKSDGAGPSSAAARCPDPLGAHTLSAPTASTTKTPKSKGVPAQGALKKPSGISLKAHQTVSANIETEPQKSK